MNHRPRDSLIWGITCYFNPVKSPVRRANYDTFRQRLGVPLVTVELAYDDSFELGPTDADIIVHRRGTDVMWQKERLLNIALDSLPPGCRSVVWLDADTVFANDAWVAQLDRALDEYALVQPFARVHLLPRGAPPGPHPDATFRDSAAAAFATDLAVDDWMQRFGDHGGRKVGLGYAWAARRDLLRRHGFYDAAIIGGGDRAVVCAAYGHFAGLIEKHRMNPRQKQRFLDWAVPFQADVGGRVGWIDGDLYHLWHGHIESRRYAERHAALAAQAFDPYTDIAIGEGGVWQWNSDKLALHRMLAEYFVSRGAAESGCAR